MLGDGLLSTGILREDRISATLEAIAEGFRAARDLGADAIFAAGTAALRIATNADELLRRAEAQGTPVAVLSGDREAELAFLAVAEDPRFSDASQLAVIDPGGQSTELVIAERDASGWRETFRHSFHIGTLQMRAAILPNPTPAASEILPASSWIDDTIGTHIAPANVTRVVTLGAPGTDLVTLREGWPDWRPDAVHGAWLDYEEVGKAVGWLMRMSESERSSLPGIQPGRGPTIHLAALILERFLNALNAPGTFVSIRGWRWPMLDRMQP
jgi:exopolyphosphatase/guanosine-5'-triphosphate,3'-diphosphate pyrophosphatase